MRTSDLIDLDAFLFGGVPARRRGRARTVTSDDFDDQPPECADCNAMLVLDPGDEWPDDGEPPRCWGCQHSEIARLRARLATMEAAVRAADRLLDASDTTPIGERRYVGSIAEDRETFCTAADLLTRAANDA